jgi:predicted NAD-dependent protein-ADP-ribosyltransferase YbiA (DUF1768 family)
MQKVIEIGGYTKSPLGRRLSNFYPRPFTFDGIECGGMEGFLQSLKCTDKTEQVRIAALYGQEAKATGVHYNSWQLYQLLHWNGLLYQRDSTEYGTLIEQAYSALYEQDASFRNDLSSLGSAKICHPIGESDTSKTTLTEREFIEHLNRLRRRALDEVWGS